MSQTIDLDDIITNKEAATLLKIKPNTLEIWRHKGKGPPFLKFGDAPNGTVRYLRSAVAEWAAQHVRASTSAHTVAVRAKRESSLKVMPGAIRGPWETPRPAVSQPGGASE